MTRADELAHSAVIDKTLALLKDNYVFPDVAARMEADISARQQAGEYDRFTTAGTFADALTAHLRSVSRDMHLNVRFSAPAPAPTPAASGEPDWQSIERAANYHFARAERLPGNVGYLRLDEFADADQAEPAATAAAAMEFLRHTDALIIDVRRNGGGHPSMVALLLGYLMGPEPIVYNRFFDRPSGTTSESKTMAVAADRRYGPHRPVFVLVGERTASAAESFAYTLKGLGRASLGGEKTMGAANPGDGFDLGGGFSTFIPTGRPISPFTETNWEGVGIEPHFRAPAPEEVRTAHRRALRSLLREEADPVRRGRLEGVMDAIENPVHDP